VWVTCEDGRDFIRAVVIRSLDKPFPAYRGPQPSVRQLQKLRKQHADNLLISPPHATTGAALPPRRRISHFVMNLPDSAITFLDAFRGILSPACLGGRDISGVYDESMPMIHCHCFTREIEFDKAELDIRKVRVHSSVTPVPHY
jgi:tRNA (guanine37-N1)-methyltransferase